MRSFTSLTAACLAFVLVAAPAFAHTVPSQHPHVHAQETEQEVGPPGATRPSQAEAAEVRAQEQREQAEDRRSEAQKRACENRQAAVSRIMENLVELGERQLEVFDTIAVRVQDFYVEKELEADGYESAVAEMQAARDTAHATLDELQSAEANFDCENPDPKQQVTAFQDDLKALIADLKAYRTTIKDLVVEIKTSIDDTNESAAENRQDTATGEAAAEGETNE